MIYPNRASIEEVGDKYVLLFDVLWYRHSFGHPPERSAEDAKQRQIIANSVGEDVLADFQECGDAELAGILWALSWVLSGTWDSGWDGVGCRGVCE